MSLNESEPSPVYFCVYLCRLEIHFNLNILFYPKYYLRCNLPSQCCCVYVARMSEVHWEWLTGAVLFKSVDLHGLPDLAL